MTKRIPLYFFASFVMVMIGISMSVIHLKQSSSTNHIEFSVPFSVLEQVYQAERNSRSQTVEIKAAELLACLAAKYQGDFDKFKQQDLNYLLNQIRHGVKPESVVSDKDSFYKFLQIYEAVLSGFTDKNNDSFQVYFPLPEGFYYEDYDDFGDERTYGYTRKHLGHDIICPIGTPVVAIEKGTVEALGWNRYGGWRIGIRSFDKKRYYYYAHLQKDNPFQEGLKIGKTVCAGEVIGYTGNTGYSETENESNISVPHLHIGLELIFDEQERGRKNEIWIDLFALTRLLEKNKTRVRMDPENKCFYSVNSS